MEDLLHFVGQAPDAQQRSQEPNKQRHARRQSRLDHLRDARLAPVGYGHHRVQHRVDELRYLRALGHDERDDVDDSLDRADERRGRVEQGEDPCDAGDDDRRDQVARQFLQDRGLEVMRPLPGFP